MNVLMINTNRSVPHVSPIGLEYVCNSLLRENIRFDWVDLNFDREKLIYSKLQKNSVDVVGISMRNTDSLTLKTNEFFLPGYKKLVGRIKNTTDCNVVIGGSGFSTMPREILEYTGADFGVVSYGEEALPKLVRAVREGGDLAKIDNLIWRKNGKFQLNRCSTGNYENLPVKRRNIIRNLSYYRTYGIANVEDQRGCNRRCGYCCEISIVGPKIVTRKIVNVIEELKELKSLGIDHVYFTNSEFNVSNLKHRIEFCEQLIKSKVGITWTVSINPEPDTMPSKLLDLMKKAGCQEILMGADSGSNEILASMGKGHTVEDTEKCTEKMRKANIRPLPSYVIGWPGESSETIDETFAHIKRCRYETPVLFVGVRIFPNTRIARIAKDEGIIKTDTDLLYPVFYQPERALREFAPIVRRKIKLLSDANCLYPTRGVNFLNQLIQNMYLRGGFTSSGYTDFIDRLNNLSRMEKLGLITKTALDFALPFRRRFIPIAESDK
jgi:radical SAM superfamily enzyme YgiQ (UPF0313 family)